MIYDLLFTRDEVDVLLYRVAESQEVLVDFKRDGFSHSDELMYASILLAFKIKNALDVGVKEINLKLHYLECSLLIYFAEIGRDFAEVADTETEKDRFAYLYSSIRRKLLEVCDCHKAEISNFGNMSPEKRLLHLKDECPITDNDYKEGRWLLKNFEDFGVEYAADIVKKNLKKNIMMMELSGISVYDVKLVVSEEQYFGLASENILEENPDGQLTEIYANICLNKSKDDYYEDWINIGQVDGIFVHMVETEDGLLEGADTYDQALFDAISTAVELNDKYPRRTKTGIFHIQQVFLKEEYRGLGIGKVALPIFLIRSVRGASLATAYAYDDAQAYYLNAVGFEKVDDDLWFVRL